MNIVSKYQYVSPPGVTYEEHSSMTEQSHREECDINRIMAKYQQTGVCDHIKKYAPTYADYDAIEFQEALQTIQEGEEMFEELPSKARAYFQNDPAVFMQYMHDNPNPRNLAELGLSFRREDEPSANGPACRRTKGIGPAPESIPTTDAEETNASEGETG